MTDGTRSGAAGPRGFPRGTYLDAAVRRTGLAGIGLLTALAVAAAVLGLLGEVSGLDAGLAAALGLIGSGWLWSWGVRPRLLVDREGLVVVNPVRTIEIPWADVDSFDCHHALAVRRRDGSSVTVSALPANGLRRIVSGTPGRVDRLAMALNAHLVSAAPPGTDPPRVSVETPEGRRDLRVLGVLATVGVAVTALLRHLVG